MRKDFFEGKSKSGQCCVPEWVKKAFLILFIIAVVATILAHVLPPKEPFTYYKNTFGRLCRNMLDVPFLDHFDGICPDIV